jgi:hypothetical protein
VPSLPDLEVRRVQRNGELVLQLRCPGCGTWADLDDDQVHGRVNIECDAGTGCAFHETIDLSPAFALMGKDG